MQHRAASKYQIAFSFAGEDRPYVSRVAEELKSRNVLVFYDQYEEVALWGANLYEHLHNIYANEADFTIMFISHAYSRKLWTSHERQSAQERAFRENREYILPARFDDTELPGLFETIGYVDLRQRTPTDLADLCVKKLEAHGLHRKNADVTLKVFHAASTVIEFASLLEPDEVTLETFFEDLLTRASAVVEVTATTFQSPLNASEKQRLTEHVAAMPVSIVWPEAITHAAATIETAIPGLRSYRTASSKFYGINHRVAADHLASLTRALKAFDEAVLRIPRRLPWLWLSVLEYSNPFARNSLTIPHFVRGFRRVAALYLYSTLFWSRRRFEPNELPAVPLGDFLSPNLPWQVGLVASFDEPDEMVRAEVYRTPHMVFQEVSVYGPKQLTLDAYRACLDNRPIHNGWFSRYFVPQLELQLALREPSMPTKYDERASIRKVVDLEGDELRLDGSKVR